MKILSIGNSFSQDAQRWIYNIAKSNSDDVYAVNLFIGGCSLETHWEKFKNRQPDYSYEVNGEFKKQIFLTDALVAEEWDIITFQQASHFSGDYSTYQPFLNDLYCEVKKCCANAKFYIHQTWAYEIDSTHGAFVNYNSNQKEMYNKLTEAYKKAAESIGVDTIPTGKVIQYLRENTSEFDYRNGGLSLNRDGFHLSEIYGRYAAALTWYGVLFNKDVRQVTFVPYIEELGETDIKLIEIIKNAVYTVLNEL